MRKKIVLLLAILLIIFSFGLILGVKSATAACICVDWGITTRYVPGKGWFSVGYCREEKCAVGCRPGTYVCNRPGGCCAIETPKPAPPPKCEPKAVKCGACSASCGGGTQSCDNDCDRWTQACNTQSCAPPPPPPTCTVNLSPDPATTSTGSTVAYTASVVAANGTVDRVNFVSSDNEIASLSPNSDNSSPYNSTARGNLTGTVTVTARVMMAAAERCSDSAVLMVISPDPWWQAIGGDVVTAGNLLSPIPPGLGQSLILDGAGGYPGAAIYGGTTADFLAGTGTGTVSSKGWLANTGTRIRKTYSYQYLERGIPGDVVFNEIASTNVPGSTLATGGSQSRGYYWYRFDGTTGATKNLDLTITSSADLGSRKVVLLVKGANLNLQGNLNLTDGSGFFTTIVGKNESGLKGDIIVDPSTGSGLGPDLEGLYFADSEFKSGAGTSQLHLRGAVAAYEGVVLERDLTNDATTPAELFEYALDQVMLYPPSLSVKKMRWKEVPP